MLAKNCELTYKAKQACYMPKRFISYIVGALLLLILNPAFLIVALSIKLDSPGNIFFVKLGLV